MTGHSPTSPRAFYDQLAESYHLIFEDWDRSIERQGVALGSVLARWPTSGGRVLDVAAGIGTQSLALALREYSVVASDISSRAVLRARREAITRGAAFPVVVADFRELPFRSDAAGIVLACDNALPHLLSIGEVARALSELRRCARSGGGVVISVRNYERQPAGTREYRPYGERSWDGRRYFAEQEWEWHERTYTLTLRIRSLDEPRAPPLEVRTEYFAVGVQELLELMTAAGLRDVDRIDGVYYQPLLVGTK